MNQQIEETISIVDLQKQIGALKKRVGQEKKHLLITSHGLEFAAIIPIAEYTELKKQTVLPKSEM